MALVARHATVLLSCLLAAVAWLGGGPAPTFAIEEADRLWLVAENAFQDRLYPLARRQLERLLDRYPKDRRAPDATLLLGKARFSQKAYLAALDAFRQAAAMSPPPGKLGEARFWQAEALFRLDRFGEARDAYDQVISEGMASPLAPDALYGRAWSNRELKRSEAAIGDFKLLLSNYPEHTTAGPATFYLAKALVDDKQPEQAVALLRPFATKYPESSLIPAARFTLAQALIDSGEVADGVSEMRAFVAAYPRHELTSQARRLTTEAVVKKGSKQELSDEYKQLMAQAPATAEGLYDAGVIASRLGRGKDAESAWARLRKEFPESELAPRAALDLAQAAFGRSAFKDSAALSQAAVNGSDESVRAEGFLLLGESELRLKRYPAALQAFQSALGSEALEPDLRFRALAGSGLAMEEQQKWSQAAKYYDEVAAKSTDETLRTWAKERRAAIASRIGSDSKAAPSPKAAPDAKGKAAPKSPAGGKAQSKEGSR